MLACSSHVLGLVLAGSDTGLSWCYHVVAIDIDPQKVEMALSNAKVYGLEDYVDFIVGDFIQLAPSLKVEGSKVLKVSPGTHTYLVNRTLSSDKDKEFFEDKLLSSALAIDNLHDQIKTLSLKLESSEETVRNFMNVSEKELNELSIEKDEAEKSFRNEQCKAANLINEKETNALQVVNKELDNTIIELRKGQQFAMQDSLLKILALESESKDSTEKLQEEIQKRSEELEILQEEVDKHEQHRDSPEKQVGQLQTILEEKEQLVLRSKDREKELEDQKTKANKAVQEMERNCDQKLVEHKEESPQYLMHTRGTCCFVSGSHVGTSSGSGS
ncbi:hypothetical protein RHGRI_026484 [Rhododendron griersonianum]|uniref:Trimethylguanosine synthase n=1 Tax=Rhododendron griersonianum TaxID=479676 RepID=A0AAV6IUI6_9ERIC|nr:hypothetical protein RHGRI_026484 [Rhododendron griersonianum]